jgi:hypothetical protein
VTRSHGKELELMESQAEQCVGIFGCNDYVPFSDANIDLPRAKLMPAVASPRQVAGALTATWVNTDTFMAAWDLIIEDKKYLENDWVVKADPDTVFLAERLSMHLDAPHIRGPGSTGTGAYLKNCQGGDRGLQLYGALEVLSKLAVTQYGHARDVCRNAPDRGIMGEDMWLQRCMDSIGIVSIPDWVLVADGYCPGAVPPGDCSVDRMAFHPFKMPEQWDQCYQAVLQRQRPPAGPAPVPAPPAAPAGPLVPT